MQIPVYEKKTAPQSQPVAHARISGPVRGAFGEMESRANEGLGEQITSLGRLVRDLSEKQAQIKEKRFNAFVDSQREAYRINRPYSQNPEEDRKNFYRTLEEKGREMLGERQLSGWQERNKVLFSNYELDDAVYQTQQIRNQTLEEAKAALDEYTHLQVFGSSDRTRKTAQEVTQKLIEEASAYATPEQVAQLKERHRQQTAMSAFLYDSNTNATHAARKLQSNAYNFTPLEKARAMDSLASSVRGGGIKTNPQVYVGLEERAMRGEDIRSAANLQYVSGMLTLSDREKLLKTQEEVIPSALRQATDLIKAKFSAGDLDANFGFVKYTQEKALQSFYTLLSQNKQASQADIMGMAERVIDEYQKLDNDTIATTLPVPSFAKSQGLQRRDLQSWSEEQLDRVIETLLQQIDSGQISPQEGAYQVQQFRQWRPYIENQQKKKTAARANK